MYAVGHVALGYLLGKAVARTTGKKLNVPLVWAVSLIPDLDLLVPGLQHRGPTHSLLAIIVISVPLLLLSFRKSLPYLAAFSSHSLIGDFLTDPGIMLFWPMSSQWVKYPEAFAFLARSEVYLEIVLLGPLIVTLVLSKDLSGLLSPKKGNMLLFIPIITIILPSFFRYPLVLPRILIVPHLLLLVVTLVPFASGLQKLLVTKNRA